MPPFENADKTTQIQQPNRSAERPLVDWSSPDSQHLFRTASADKSRQNGGNDATVSFDHERNGGQEHHHHRHHEHGHREHHEHKHEHGHRGHHDSSDQGGPTDGSTASDTASSVGAGDTTKGASDTRCGTTSRDSQQNAQLDKALKDNIYNKAGCSHLSDARAVHAVPDAPVVPATSDAVSDAVQPPGDLANNERATLQQMIAQLTNLLNTLRQELQMLEQRQNGQQTAGGGSDAASGGQNTKPATGGDTSVNSGDTSVNPGGTDSGTTNSTGGGSDAASGGTNKPGDASAPKPAPGSGSDYVPPQVKGDGKTPTTAADALAGAVIPPVPADALDVRKFGATGNGSANDSAALQKAIDACPPGSTVFVPEGTYMVDVKNGGVRLKSDVTLQLDKDATIKAIPSDTVGGSILNIQGANNVNVYGGTIEGDRSTHIGRDGECEYGIGIFGSHNVNIVGVTSKNNFGDGFCVDSYKSDANAAMSSDVHFVHDVAEGNRRNGMSIVGVNGMTVEDSAFLNNGGNDSIDPTVVDGPQQLPMDGIDVEPDAGKTTKNIIIKNNLIAGNARECDNVWDNGNGFGLRLTGGNGFDTGNRVIDNIIVDNAAGGIGVWTGDHTISGNTIQSGKNGYVVYKGSGSGEGNTINGAPGSPSSG